MLHKFRPEWGSHIPLLIQAFNVTNGPVLELGMGINSTPLLHALCEDKDRFLLSLDNDPEFVEMFRRYRTADHEIELVNWDEAQYAATWGLVFVDHKPEERRIEAIKKLADRAVMIVLHDSEPENAHLYKYDEIYPLFKYRFFYYITLFHQTSRFS